MKKNKSFTIVESMIAMSIFTLVIGGSIFLIQQTLVMNSLASQRLTAYYLAQEGIELVRNIRDSNWLQQQTNSSFNWAAGLSTSTFNWNASDHSLDFEMDYNDNALTAYSVNNKFRFLSLDSNKGYTYDISCPTANSANCTKFTRWMRIGSVASDGATSSIRVECHVEWRERSRLHSVVVKEKLYNWFGI